jgi:hypothetical protein
MKIKPFVNAVLGISIEVLYSLFIMLVAFLICLVLSLKI